jgi:hypothetical protein
VLGAIDVVAASWTIGSEQDENRLRPVRVTCKRPICVSSAGVWPGVR